jgi:hypothetical protein
MKTVIVTVKEVFSRKAKNQCSLTFKTKAKEKKKPDSIWISL